MDYFATWIRQIILVVILATFLELLLPNNAMQRYVRFVMGLVILVMMLSPLFVLFQQDWTVEQLLSQEQTELKPDMTSLEEIRRQSEQLADSQRNMTQDVVRERVSEEMTHGIEQTFPVTVQNVDLQFTERDEGHAIGQVTVTLQHDPTGGERGDSVKPIEPVEPVVIEWGEQEHEQSTAVSRDRSQKGIPIPSIQHWVAEQWQVDENQIRIKATEKGG